MRKQLYWLSDSEWKRLEPLLRGAGAAHTEWMTGA